MKKHTQYLLIVCFLEGATVMAVELMGARLIAPWFGTSLYVWSSVLGVTMVGLAAGYYFGGKLSKRQNHDQLLTIGVLLSAAFVGIMPFSSQFILDLTSNLDVRTGSLISAMVYLLPPVFFLGALSPLIIEFSSPDHSHTGKIAGLVYGISTAGGVISAIFCGFFLIPFMGIYQPAWLFFLLLLLAAAMVFITQKKARKEE